MNHKKILLALVALFFGTIEAQQSRFFQNKNEYLFDLAGKNYQIGIFASAQYEYARQYFFNQNLSNTKKEFAIFYDKIIALILNQTKAEEGFEAFGKEYPHSVYFSQASLPLSDYYLRIKKFDEAIKVLNKINKNNLSKDAYREYILKLGYAKYMVRDSRGAISVLEEAYGEVEGEDKDDICYMIGHLYYTEHNNERAFRYFNEIKETPKYYKLVKPYYVQLYFNEKQYDKAIKTGEELLNEELSNEYNAEVHKIIGESYFMKEDYKHAYPHLKYFVDNKAIPSENDLYEMGFVSAQLKKYNEAITYYNQLINSRSKLAQNAYYQLGNAYIEENKKEEALSAFRSAYQMDYDAEVKKLAHLQYAKLSYDVGNPYEFPSQVIQNYISTYPNDKQIPELKKLLVKSYLYSKNYKETLKAIDKIDNPSDEIKKINQQVSFFLGTEEYNRGNYQEAQKYFYKSLQQKYNKEYYLKALYWLGQTYYHQLNYSEAISQFEQLLPYKNEVYQEKQQLYYDLGYAYFELKKFDEARKYFIEYLKNPKSDFKSDAELRLADTYYADNQLDNAISIYDKQKEVDDYTIYQKAMALGYKGNIDGKITELKKLVNQYKDSDYKDIALYEMASSYSEKGSYDLSNDYYSKVIKTSRDQELIANSEIERAQNYIEQNQENKAISEFRTLAQKYKGTIYLDKIMIAVKPAFMKKADALGYQNFANEVGTKIDKSDLDLLNYQSAHKYFTEKNYQKAISFYEKYLSQNPSDQSVYQAEFELGECYYKIGEIQKSIIEFEKVANIQNEFQEEAGVRISQNYLSQNKPKLAQKYLEMLVNSSRENIRSFAYVELMKLESQQNHLAEAEKYANEVLKNTKNSSSILEQAKVIKARNLMMKGKDDEAKKQYSQLEKSLNPSVAAQALYAKAYYQNKAKSYQASNQTIFKLANNYASEEYWGAKSLVVMARNYLALKDKYQASYTCDQIIENYKNFSDVVSEAKEVKKMIK